MSSEEQLSFQSSSGASSRASDLLDTREDTSTFAVEQESAKLQAEVQKLSQELEDLMTSRGIVDASSVKPEFGCFDAVCEELEDENVVSEAENSFSPLEARNSRFSPHFHSPLLQVSDHTPVRDLPSPSFAKSQVTPEKDRFSEPLKGLREKPSPKKRHSSVSWRQVNDLLLEEGFTTVPIHIEHNGKTVSDWEAMGDTLRTVLIDYRDMRRDYEKKIALLESELNIQKEDSGRTASKFDEIRFNYEREIREMRRELSNLQNKVDSCQSQCQLKDRLIADLRATQSEQDTSTLPEVFLVSSDKEKAVFRKHFGREPQSMLDAKVLGLISSYEDKRMRATPDKRNLTESARLALLQENLKNTKRELSEVESRRHALAEENNRLKFKLSSESPTIAQIQALLDLKSESQMIDAIRKMLQVIRALPGLEHFIKTVSAEVVDIDASASGIDSIVPTIKAWKAKALQCDELLQLKTQLCRHLSMDVSCSPSDLVIVTQVQRVRQAANESTHVRKLFDIAENEDSQQRLNQVLLFVHEMKGLLQFARQELCLEGGVSVKEQVERVKQQLRRMSAAF